MTTTDAPHIDHPEQAPKLDADDIDLAILGEFVTGTLAVIFARKVTDIDTAVWCPDWWRHPEAVERLELLRLLRLAATDPDTRSDWWELHAGPHMTVLFDPVNGPFRCCSARSGHKDGIPALPCTTPTAATRTALHAA